MAFYAILFEYNLLSLLTLISNCIHLSFKSFLVSKIVVLDNLEVVIELIYKWNSCGNVNSDNLFGRHILRRRDPGPGFPAHGKPAAKSADRGRILPCAAGYAERGDEGFRPQHPQQHPFGQL